MQQAPSTSISPDQGSVAPSKSTQSSSTSQWHPIEIRSFDRADEVKELGPRATRYTINCPNGRKLNRLVVQPGWKWSIDMKPIVNTDLCIHSHCGYLLSGAMTVVRYNSDHSEAERVHYKAGAVFQLPPNHDGWVEGDQPAICIDISNEFGENHQVNTEFLVNKSFHLNPDERRQFNNGYMSLIHLDSLTIASAHMDPGWRWMNDIKPLAKTEWCEHEHIGYVLTGEMHIQLPDGSEMNMKAGESFYIPSKHDGWVMGDQPFECVEFTSGKTYAKPQK